MKPISERKKSLPERQKVGRPLFAKSEVQGELVLRLAVAGAKKMEIARILEISVPTLKKYFQLELDKGAAFASLAVARTMLGMATDINHPKAFEAARFWLTHKAGWRIPGNVCERCGTKIRSR